MSNIYNKYKRYNPEGMLVETRFLFKDETIYLRSEYYYNPQGKLFMERQNSDKIMFVYDPQGFLVKEVTYSPGGFLKSCIDYEVDAQGHREKETYYMSNAPTESTTYQYNRKGQVIESIKYDKEEEIVLRYSKILDETIKKGLHTEGLLPGKLKIERKAKSFYEKENQYRWCFYDAVYDYEFHSTSVSVFIDQSRLYRRK